MYNENLNGLKLIVWGCDGVEVIHDFKESRHEEEIRKEFQELNINASFIVHFDSGIISSIEYSIKEAKDGYDICKFKEDEWNYNDNPYDCTIYDLNYDMLINKTLSDVSGVIEHHEYILNLMRVVYDRKFSNNKDLTSYYSERGYLKDEVEKYNEEIAHLDRLISLEEWGINTSKLLESENFKEEIFKKHIEEKLKRNPNTQQYEDLPF